MATAFNTVALAANPQSNVVRLPSAAKRKVRQHKGPEAEAERLQVLLSQRHYFGTDAKNRDSAEAFEVCYKDCLRHREILNERVAKFVNETELGFAEEATKLRLLLAGGVACYRVRLCQLADMAAPSAEWAAKRRDLIGEKWLKAEDPFYDRFREAVKADQQKWMI